MPQIAPIIGAVAAVVGTAGSLYYQSKSLSAQNKAAKEQEKQQDLQTLQSNRAAVRQAQLARAQAVMGAVGSGAINGSGAFGGIGGITSQLGASLGYQTQYNAMSQNISQYGTQANQANAMSGIFSGIGSIGAKIFNASGGFGAMAGGQPAQSTPAVNYTPTYKYTNSYNPAPTRPPSYNPTTRPTGYI